MEKFRAFGDVAGTIARLVAMIGATVVASVALSDHDWLKATAYFLLAILVTLWQLAERDRS